MADVSDQHALNVHSSNCLCLSSASDDEFADTLCLQEVCLHIVREEALVNTSRARCVDIKRHARRKDDDSTSYDGETWFFRALQALALVPYADLLNHSPYSTAYFMVNNIPFSKEKEVTLYADRNYARNDQARAKNMAETAVFVLIAITPTDMPLHP
eukprot:6206416-Pleurochrysis_carterae.AAC.1